jgi:hypothetical protein
MDTISLDTWGKIAGYADKLIRYQRARPSGARSRSPSTPAAPICPRQPRHNGSLIRDKRRGALGTAKLKTEAEAGRHY